MPLKPLTKEQKELWRKDFKKADKDGSGKLSKSEVRVVCKEILDGLEIDFTDADLKEIMDEIDKNKDGYLDFNEFCTMMEKFIGAFVEGMEEALSK